MKGSLWGVYPISDPLDLGYIQNCRELQKDDGPP